MKKYEFNYSKNFKCIGSSCKHNCCVGWEIFIDKKTREFYESLKEVDPRFDGISYDNGCVRLDKNFRCPYLDGDNLCHIIKNYGEKNLSKTCKTHPRFINFFSSFTETGLGLYCEEACKIILSLNAKMKPVLVYKNKFTKPLTPLEKKILALRKEALGIAQDRTRSISERLNLLEKLSKIDLNRKDFSAWAKIFDGLEKLNANKDYFSFLHNLESFPVVTKNDYSVCFEQVLSYLIYRHVSRAIDEIDSSVRLAFVVLSFKIIYCLFVFLGDSLDALIEACRFYTSTVELSDDNCFSLFNEIEKLMVLSL